MQTPRLLAVALAIASLTHASTSFSQSVLSPVASALNTGYAIAGDHCGGTITGTMATDWSENSCHLAPVGLRYALDTGANAPDGGAALKVTSGNGQAQFWTGFDVVPGQKYKGRVYLKADKATEVMVQVRLRDAPYTTLGVAMAQIGTAWTPVDVTADAPVGAACSTIW